MRYWVLALASLATALPAAAAPRRVEPEREVRRTSRVTYYADAERSVDVRRTEDFLDRLDTLFGKPPAGWRLEYHRHAASHVAHPESGAAAYGVTDLDLLRIDSVFDFHPHELVHAAAARFGRPPLLFAEGLAVALTSRGQWHGKGLDQAALSALAGARGVTPFLDRFTDQDPDAAYAVAGSFVSHLLERHGIEAFLRFAHGCRGDGRFETPFRRAFGTSFARAAIEWEAALRQGRAEGARAFFDPATWPGSLRGEDRAAVAARAAGTDDGAPAAQRRLGATDARSALELASTAFSKRAGSE